MVSPRATSIILSAYETGSFVLRRARPRFDRSPMSEADLDREAAGWLVDYGYAEWGGRNRDRIVLLSAGIEFAEKAKSRHGATFTATAGTLDVHDGAGHFSNIAVEDVLKLFSDSDLFREMERRRNEYSASHTHSIAATHGAGNGHSHGFSECFAGSASPPPQTSATPKPGPRQAAVNAPQGSVPTVVPKDAKSPARQASEKAAADAVARIRSPFKRDLDIPFGGTWI